MSSSAVAAPTSGGRGRSYFPLVILAVAAALAVAATQSRVKERERVRESPKERGIQYEDHVLAPTNLPQAVQLSGGTLRVYPHLYVPQTTMPARYYKSPNGYDGRTTRDRAPHDSAPRRWEAVDVGGYRIPDAMETQADGSEVLYELKCPSPWLVFGSGNPWAGKMQAAFGSQALAYVIWAKAGPKRRITYGREARVRPVGGRPKGEAGRARAQVGHQDPHRPGKTLRHQDRISRNLPVCRIRPGGCLREHGDARSPHGIRPGGRRRSCTRATAWRRIRRSEGLEPMHSIAALPVIPLLSLAGVPPAEELPTLIARRRYAFSLASALAGEQCYELKVWSRKKVPLLLQLRAAQEDWPMIGTSHNVTIMHPLPLPEDPAELFERAAAAVTEAEQAAVGEVLMALWAGAVPNGLPVELQTRFGDAIRNSGLKASEEAFQAACVADPVPRQRKKKAAGANVAGQS